MTHLGHDLLQKLNLISAVSMFLLIVVFFILQYIFDMEFVCSCRPDLYRNRILYLIIPPLILTWVVYITEPFHQARTFSFFQSITDNKICWFCAELLVNYVSLLALWVTAVLFDGDWYICLKTNLNPNQIGIPCKEHLTYEERQIKAGYKTDSLDIGLGLISILIVVWSIIESITAYYNRQKTWKRGPGHAAPLDMLLPPYYRKVYEGLLEEQVSVYLREELTKIAAERAKAICQPHLYTIGNHEQLLDNPPGGEDRIIVLEAWKKISASDFPFTSRDSHVGSEMVEEEPLEERDRGSTSSDRRLMT